MNLSNPKLRFLFVTHLALGVTFVAIFFAGLLVAPVNAATDGWHIKDDATGGECSVIGIWDAESKTCTLSQDLSRGIIIDSNYIILNGSGRTITGNNTGYENGVYLSSRTGVVIKNLNIQKFYMGIFLSYSNMNTITHNTANSNNHSGIYIASSNNNTLANNTANSNSAGYTIYSSNNNTLANNIAGSNGNGIWLTGFSDNNILANNTANSNDYGINLGGSSGNTLINNTANSNDYGISLAGGLCARHGIWVWISCTSDYNTIISNTTNSNLWYGIWLAGGDSFNSITKNAVLNNYVGINLDGSNNNILTNNTVSNGTKLNYSSNNQIYRNNFIINSNSSNNGSGNIFNLTVPIGGNYWSNFDEPTEGCADANNDGFCDVPYIFVGGQDNLPWTKKDGWLAPPNNSPILSGLEQFDGATLLSEGRILQHPYISSFSANVSDPDGDLIQLQVELRRFEEPFTGNDDGGIFTSDSVPSETVARVPEMRDGVRLPIPLSDGKYHWRARAIDSNGNKSGWQEFGVAGNVDFEILTNQSQCEGVCITDINPKSGAPGIPVTIEGRNFDNHFGLSRVYFGSNIAEKISWEENKIIVKAPLVQDAQTVDVQISTSIGDSNERSFTYNKPSIDGLQPQTGDKYTPVKILGSDFGIPPIISSLFRVKFGKSLVPYDQEKWSDKEIEVTPPSDYGTGENDQKFLICLFSAVVPTGEWLPAPILEACIDWLGTLALNNIYLDTQSGEINVDVKVTTPVGESNASVFTYQLLPLIQVDLNSPGELRVYDSQKRVSGLIQGEVREEIPLSVYYSEGEMVAIPMANNQYSYEVVGTGNDVYNLNLLLAEQATTTIFQAIDIPIKVGEVQKYTVDWEKIHQNSSGVTLEIDADGDGIFEKKIVADAALTQNEFILQTETNIDIAPDVLNLKSKGDVITAYIELPHGFTPDNIDVATIMLNGVIPAMEKPVALGDYDNDGTADLMVKFNKKEVEQLFQNSVEKAEMYISGRVSHAGEYLEFAGIDYVRLLK